LRPEVVFLIDGPEKSPSNEKERLMSRDVFKSPLASNDIKSSKYNFQYQIFLNIPTLILVSQPRVTQVPNPNRKVHILNASKNVPYFS